jgi:hypothetical protein
MHEIAAGDHGQFSLPVAAADRFEGSDLAALERSDTVVVRSPVTFVAVVSAPYVEAQRRSVSRSGFIGGGGLAVWLSRCGRLYGGLLNRRRAFSSLWVAKPREEEEDG